MTLGLPAYAKQTSISRSFTTHAKSLLPCKVSPSQVQGLGWRLILRGPRFHRPYSLKIFSLHDGFGASKHVFIFRFWRCTGHRTSLSLISPLKIGVRNPAARKGQQGGSVPGQAHSWGLAAGRMTCWSDSPLCYPLQALPFVYCLKPIAFCLSEAKNAPDHPVTPSAFTFSLSHVWAGFAFGLLSRLHEAFPVSLSAPQEVLSSKQTRLLVGWVYLLFISLASGGRERNIHRDQNLGIWEPRSLWRDWAHWQGSDGTPGRRKSRLKQKIGKEKC